MCFYFEISFLNLTLFSPTANCLFTCLGFKLKLESTWKPIFIHWLEVVKKDEHSVHIFLCNHSVILVSGWKLCVSKRILRAAETYCLTSRRVFWGPWLMSKSWISALRVVLFVESHAPRPYMWWNNKAIHRIIKIIALVKVCADHMACCWA